MEHFTISTSIGNCIAINAQVDGHVADGGSHKLIAKALPPKSKLQDLGALDKLPSELKDMILLQLDLRTIVRFRAVNAKARLLVDSHRDYNIIRESAPDAICALHRLRLASSVTCKQLLDTLHSTACGSCGKNAAYLYLFTCTRVCRPCFVKEKRYLPLPFTAAQNSYSLNSRILKTLPRIRVKARKSGRRHEGKKGYHFLHDPTAAWEAGIKKHGTKWDMRRSVRKKEEARQRRLARKGMVSSSAMLEDRQEHNWRRFVAISRVPWVCNETKKVHEGVYCKPCFGAGVRSAFFTQEALEMHLETCPVLSASR